MYKYVRDLGVKDVRVDYGLVRKRVGKSGYFVPSPLLLIYSFCFLMDVQGPILMGSTDTKL